MQGDDSGGGFACVRTGVYGNSFLSVILCCEPKTPLKKLSLLILKIPVTY